MTVPIKEARMTRASSGPTNYDGDFTEFVQASWAGLYRTAFMLLGDRGLAEDLAQTALTKTYAAWTRIDDRSAARAYAQRTLINTAASWFRRKGWRNERPTVVLPEASEARDPGARSEMMDALAQLPPRQRAVVVLRYYEDLSVAETANALGCSTGTVKSQTFEAFTKLRILLGDAAISDTLETNHG
jgi:RNA polymerase sigma-70 factor (sigma-E family)